MPLSWCLFPPVGRGRECGARDGGHGTSRLCRFMKVATVTVTLLMTVGPCVGRYHHDHHTYVASGLTVEGRALLQTVSGEEERDTLFAVEQDMVEYAEKQSSSTIENRNDTDGTYTTTTDEPGAAAFDVIIETSEEGRLISSNPTPVFVVDFGRNITEKNPLKLFEISGSNRVDVLYSQGLGLLYVMAAVTDDTSPGKVSLTVNDGATQDLNGRRNAFAEKYVTYAPEKESSSSNSIADVAGWGMLGGLALSFGATLISPTATIGIGAMNFAGFVQTFYMSGNLPITNMPENYKAATSGLVADWVLLNPPYGPVSTTSSMDQDEAKDILNDLSVRLPYPPLNISSSSVVPDGAVSEEVVGNSSSSSSGGGGGDSDVVSDVVTETLPPKDLVDHTGKPANPFKDSKRDDSKSSSVQDDLKSSSVQDNSGASVAKVPVKQDVNVVASPDSMDDKAPVDRVKNDYTGDDETVKAAVVSPPPPKTKAAAPAPGSFDYAYVEPLIGGAPDIAPNSGDGKVTNGDIEVPYEDVNYAYEDPNWHNILEEEKKKKEDQEEKEKKDTANDEEKDTTSTTSPPPASPSPDDIQGDYTEETKNEDTKREEEKPQGSIVEPLIGEKNDDDSSDSDKDTGDVKIESPPVHPPPPSPKVTESDEPYEDVNYTYEDPNLHNFALDDKESADNKADTPDEGQTETDEQPEMEAVDESTTADASSARRRRKLLLADPISSLGSSGFSYVVVTATPDDVSNNATAVGSTEDSVGSSILSRIRAIQVSAGSTPSDSERLNVLWNVLFWSAMLLLGIFVIHATILVILRLAKCETVPKMLHIPRLELLAFTMMLPMIAAAGASALQSTSAGAIAAGICFGVLIPFGYLLGAGIFLAFAIIRPTISKRRAVYVVDQTDILAISAPTDAQIDDLNTTATAEESDVESSHGSASRAGIETSMLSRQMRHEMVDEEERIASEVTHQPSAEPGRKKWSDVVYKWFLSPVFGFNSPYRSRSGSSDQDPSWLGRGKLDAVFVKRYGCFFEDAHGPQVYRVRSRYDTIQSLENHPNETTSGDILVPVGIEGAIEVLQTYGILFAALKMVLFAVIINAPGGVNNVAQVVVLTLVALLHMIYLRICVPYRLKIELAAEIVAAVCDMAVFICGIILVSKKTWSTEERHSMGIAMVVLQAVGFLVFITVRLALALRTATMTIGPAVKGWYARRKS